MFEMKLPASEDLSDVKLVVFTKTLTQWWSFKKTEKSAK